MTQPTNIPIFLTEIEAKEFIKFQKHRALIGLLESMNVFGMTDSSVTLHFDHYGQIKTVEKHEYIRL